MVDRLDVSLLEAVLDSWDRNNAILVNLVRAVPEGGLAVRAMEDSPSVAAMFTHMHYVRLVLVSEDAPEFATKLPEEEWAGERDPERIAQILNESAKVVRDAVQSRVKAGRDMDLHYDHPILMLQHLIWRTRATITGRLSWPSSWRDGQSALRRLGQLRGGCGCVKNQHLGNNLSSQEIMKKSYLI
jgi:hypothetical protein